MGVKVTSKSPEKQKDVPSEHFLFKLVPTMTNPINKKLNLYILDKGAQHIIRGACLASSTSGQTMD